MSVPKEADPEVIPCENRTDSHGLILAYSWGRINYLSFYYENMIPKIFHYCWFGGGPESHAEFRKGWQQIHPNWNIRRWDEETCAEIDHPYYRTALETKSWANAANYVRIYNLQRFGGVYLDTDVEVIKPFDDILDCPAFVGFQIAPELYREDEMVNNAVWGSTPDHECLERLLWTFDVLNGDERANISSPRLITDYLVQHGLKYGEEKVRCADIDVYPKDVFYPYSWKEKYSPECITERTRAIHHWDLSWWKSPFSKIEKNPISNA